ncbi:uncharacterized protein EDB91DRAFT_1145129 [Suillus paluster]|uniref:uncharacterized protein n=1 Tax=Suillus paluster TaxID=48578 RepID=UPI001B8867C9|nr:uncharacterized protein EDB91DRAFT_1145129 [Suillus paluster]KAG1735077.1 hypothetical protein EDB91DRAFT_1145129 [Suillus paluster]
MTTWAQAIHHPWFDPSPLKRKSSTADDERRPSPYQRSSPSPTSGAKRRKFDTLEHGFAHLTLASAPVHPTASGLVITPIHPTASSPETTVFSPASVVLPSSVEEPPHETEAFAPEVSMDEGDSSKLHNKAPRFSISTPLLRRIRRHHTAPQPIIPISSPSTAAGAVILYRPLRPLSPSPKVEEQAGESVEEIITCGAAASVEVDDDAMDIE